MSKEKAISIIIKKKNQLRKFHINIDACVVEPTFKKSWRIRIWTEIRQKNFILSCKLLQKAR